MLTRNTAECQLLRQIGAHDCVDRVRAIAESMELGLQVLYGVVGTWQAGLASRHHWEKGGKQHERQVAGSHGCRSCA